MELFYVDKTQDHLIFPHWINHTRLHKDDNFFLIMDINQWVIDTFGPIGDVWGHDRQQGPRVEYSWRFKNKSDAMLFKLKWA